MIGRRRLLGAGAATVGLALAERYLRERYGSEVMDHNVYGICSDGDLMEGVSAEAASIAGHLGLGGPLPVNTHGGNLAEAYTHGMTHVNEAVRQIRGSAINQIDGATNVLVVGGAGPAPTSGMILTGAR